MDADLTAEQSLFHGLDGRAREELLARLGRVALPGGEVLFREGDPADALYILRSGAIGISIRDGQGRQRRIARIFPPETVGEMALVSHSPHRSATAVALRDSTLLTLTREAFDRLVEERPAAMLYLARILSDRLRRATASAPLPHQPSTFAIVPVTPGVRAAAFGEGLMREMQRFCGRIALLGAQPEGADEAWFHRFETGHDKVLYIADRPDSDWAELCIRHADHLLLLARPGEAPLPGSPEPGAPEEPSSAFDWRRRDLVVVQKAGAVRPEPVHEALGRLAINLRLQARDGDAADLGRVARMVCGRALGIALGGGGARGFAHIGVLQALAEHGQAVDLAAGASMGAIVAAGCAMGWDPGEVRERIAAAFVENPPLDDYTLPFVALLRGRKADMRLMRHFGDARIEDLWLPCFCVSSNLTTGASKVHTSGPLWRALRASIAIPGFLPPVVEPDGVLVDGAVMNNLPADILANLQRGPVLAVDVARDDALAPMASESRITAFTRRVLGVPPEMPTIVNLLFRAATAPSDAQTALARAHATAILRPPLAGVDLRAWRRFESAVRIGYDHAKHAFEAGLLKTFEP